MWKPREVIPEHRRRAWVVWAGLLLAITAYAVWEIIVINDKYKNPSTSTTVKNEYFQFPFVTVSLDLGTGCSRWSNCASTASQFSEVYFDGSGSSSYYSSGSDDYESILVDSKHPGCIGFNLSQHTVRGFETAVIDMVWEVSGGSSTSSTWSDSLSDSTWTDDSTWSDSLSDSTWSDSLSDSSWNSSSYSSSSSYASSYFEHVYVFLNAKEPDELDDTTYLTMPYQPVTTSTVETADSYLTIGKTIKSALNGEVQISFPALTLSQSKYKMDSFYLLLIVVWGLCFVMKRQERGPALKGRTFKIPRKKKGKTRTRSTVTPAEGEEQPPHWEADDEAGDSRNDSATTTLPVGASGLAAKQKEDDSTGVASLPAGPKNEHPRRDVAASTGTSNSRRGADAPTVAFGRGFFRPAFSQHRKKSNGSLDSTEHAATKRASFRRAVEIENPIRTGSGSYKSRGGL